MGVRIDISDMDSFVRRGKDEVRSLFERKGTEAVAKAREDGSYKDNTGNLRASNRYTATEDSLVVENTAEYASEVEDKGYEVLSGSFLKTVSDL